MSVSRSVPFRLVASLGPGTNRGCRFLRVRRSSGWGMAVCGCRLAAVAFVVAGCVEGSGPVTTQTAPPPTTQTAATATTAAPSPTSTTAVSSSTASSVEAVTIFDFGEIDYPENPATVDDLPEALTFHIDGPMPDPDLSISGPEDLDRWMTGWLDWYDWVFANPAQGVEHLDVNMTALFSQMFADLRSDLVDLADVGQKLLDLADADQKRLGGGFVPSSLAGSFNELFDDKIALAVGVVAGVAPSYIVDRAGDVVSMSEGSDGEVLISAVLRYDQERDEWLMQSFEVLGPV